LQFAVVGAANAHGYANTNNGGGRVYFVLIIVIDVFRFQLSNHQNPRTRCSLLLYFILKTLGVWLGLRLSFITDYAVITIRFLLYYNSWKLQKTAA